MAYSAVKNGLVTLISGVPGVENVYGYRRNIETRAKRDEIIIDSVANTLHTWQVRRVAAPSEGNLDGDVTRTHIFEVHAWYQIEDANDSENTFQLLLEAVMDELNANRTIVSSAHIADSAQLKVFEDAMFASVLCHHAVIEVSVEDDVDP